MTPPFRHPPTPDLVSICVVAYKSADVVGECVDSCLAQTYPHVEVIVADDNSPDATLAALRRFGDRIQVVARERNGGCGAARNSAMSLARGEFIAWMDADDLCRPERIALEVAALAARPAAVLVSSEFAAFGPAGPIDERYALPYYRAFRRNGGPEGCFPRRFTLERPAHSARASIDVREGDIYEGMLDGNFIHPPSILARRAAHEVAGPFAETWRYNHDYDLSLRLLRQGPALYIDEPLLDYRISPGQLSATAGERLPLETITLLEQVRRDDPAVARRLAALFERRIAESHMDVAEATAETDGRAALRSWARGMGKHRDPRAWRILAKALLPVPVLAAVRRTRQRA